MVWVPIRIPDIFTRGCLHDHSLFTFARWRLALSECCLADYNQSITKQVVSGRTLKNSRVVPESTVPYLISVCLARSSADSIGDCIRSTVKNAARLAVYDEITISVKNHQIPPTIRPDTDLPHRHRHHQLSV